VEFHQWNPGLLDQQEVPALHLHHVSPGDILRLAARGRLLVRATPHLLEQTHDAAEAAEVRDVAQLPDALGEERPEGRARRAHGAADKVHPDHAPVEPVRPAGDELQDLGELRHQADAAGLAGAEARDQAAEVDARGEAEGGRDVLAQLLRAQRAVHAERDLRPRLAHLGQPDLVAEAVHELADLDVVHAVELQRLEAGDLGDEVHDAVFAAHELAQADGAVGGAQVLLAVGVREGRGAALDRGAEDVDPACERHVEWRLVALLVHLGDDSGKLQLLHQRDGRLEVLVPWDIWERVVEAANGALEEYHAEGGLEDLLMLFVAVEGAAELGDGGVAVAHDVIVDLIVLDIHRSLVMLSRDAKAAV